MGFSPQPFDAPPPKLIAVRATTALADGQPQRTPLDPGGASEVLSTASIILKFDRFLLPSSATRQSICLWSNLTVDVQTLEDCQNVAGAVRVFLEPTYNPVEREIILRRPPDQPRLTPGVRYRLAVLAPTGPDDPYGIRAFDGAPLPQTQQIDFAVAAQDPPGAADELPPDQDLFCAPVGGVASYMQSCTFGAGCHRSVPGVSDAVMGLDLATASLIQATAIGKVAHQTQTGEHADEPDVTPRRFGRAMPLIDALNPGNSYLLYKTIIGPNAIDPALPPDEAAALAAEIDRLRGAVVVGLPMPPQQTPSFWLHAPADPMVDPSLVVPRVDGGDMDAITAWIAQGAPTRDCPAP